uniref:V-type proton ATPase subunit E n=1 Tax=Spongospora subterranea TaxID=70186 RepID=A0A0H5R671_9EUKA|eukprot:CRZ09650.1 hypothetical protein [Spongospora subterranea]
MNSAEASRQISQMVEFIKQEAKEKAEEIRVKTDQEYNINKLSLIEVAKQNIISEFEQMRKEKVTNQKVARSAAIQLARRDRLQHQENLVESIRKTALERLSKVPNESAYEKLTIALIVQGLIRLRDDRVKIRCRNEDAAIVTKCIARAKSQYNEIMARDVGIGYDVELAVDSANSLPSSCAGGIQLLAQNDKIMISNTINSRLALCFDDFKPVMREILFGN